MSERMKTVLTVLATIAFIWLMADFFRHADSVHERAKYTIGYVRGSHWAVKSGKRIDYFISVNGQKYKGGDDELPGMRVNGGRYLVKYDSLNPQWKAVYYQYPVPDSIKDAPANGWLTPPFPVPADITSREVD